MTPTKSPVVRIFVAFFPGSREFEQLTFPD